MSPMRRTDAEELRDLGEEALGLSTQLESALERARAAVERALARLGSLDRELDPTDEQARRVAEVAKDAGEAATRTDLLALNFQVEAARLGEEDRGLERVAYEIRSLADRGVRGASEVAELASQLLRSAGAVRDATSASRASLDAAREGLSEALRRGERVAEVLSRAQAAAEELAALSPAQTAGALAAGALTAGALAAGDAATRLASAAEAREGTIRALAEVSGARLWQTLVDLRGEGQRAEASAELLRQFDERLRELFALVTDADEIARRAKQLALNADLAANRSEDPAFSLFAEEARRLSEQAETTAAATESRLTETQALIAPELSDRQDRLRALLRLAGELERVLRGFGTSGERVADQAELEQVWRADRASARALAEARASYRAQGKEPSSSPRDALQDGAD
ncbi:MAG: methyl-accepting chemotaxis protein [Planctomycetota bacterium]